jgi:hypothetical protein
MVKYMYIYIIPVSTRNVIKVGFVLDYDWVDDYADLESDETKAFIAKIDVSLERTSFMWQ